MSSHKTVIAITGGTGFIGRHLVNRLRSDGHSIRQLTRRLHDGGFGDDVRLLELNDTPIESKLLSGCDIVVHLAAHVPSDHADPTQAWACLNVNALGTLRLAEAAAKAGVRQFIHSTSANAYAPGEDLPCESAALFPRSRGFYLGSKILQEIYAAEVCRAAALQVTTLRLGSVYGPGQSTGAVATLARKAISGDRIMLVGGGGFGADFVHVDDVVAAIIILIAKASNGPFNVGSGVRTTIAEVARLLVSAAGGDLARIERTHPLLQTDQGFPALSIERLQRLGYAPRSPAHGLRSTIAALDTPRTA